MLNMGGTVTLNSLVVYLAYNTEKILLGRFWGAEALGLYGRAFALANLPVQQLNSSLNTVAFPALSSIQGDPERLNRSFLKGYAVVISVTIPVTISCALFAEEIVRILLGPKWIGAAPVLRLLVPTVLVFALVNPFAWFLQATGRVSRSLNIAWLIAPIVILGVVALGYLSIQLGQVSFLGSRGYAVTVDFPSVGGLKAGSAVEIAGVEIGRVESIFQNALPPLALLILGLTLSFGVYVWTLLFAMGQKSVYVDLVSHVFRSSRLAGPTTGPGSEAL